MKTKDQKSKIETGLGIHRDRIFTITLKVRTISKGEGIKLGDEIIIEAWKPTRRIPPLPGLQGHESIPEKGAKIIAYLTRKGEGTPFKPLLPNGIDIQ